jgi:hypothetical protein
VSTRSSTRPLRFGGAACSWLRRNWKSHDRSLADPRPRGEHKGLRVAAASPRHLLAMKVLAARRRDADDIRVLVKHLGLQSVDEVLAVCAAIFPDEAIPPRARLVLDDIFEDGSAT